jgi:hypothetical protein
MHRQSGGGVPVKGDRILRQDMSSLMGRQDFQCPSVYHTLPPFSVTTASAKGRYGSRSRTVLVLAPEISTTLIPCSLAALSIARDFVEIYPFWPVLDIGKASISDSILCRLIIVMATVRIHRTCRVLRLS